MGVFKTEMQGPERKKKEGCGYRPGRGRPDSQRIPNNQNLEKRKGKEETLKTTAGFTRSVPYLDSAGEANWSTRFSLHQDGLGVCLLPLPSRPEGESISEPEQPGRNQGLRRQGWGLRHNQLAILEVVKTS